MADVQRLPAFLIIGAMKAGTTTLYEWLNAQPEIFMPRKEVHFFSRTRVWRRGPAWYSNLFADAQEGQLLGEASASYIEPPSSRRITELIPNARLICVLREPTQRLRSHYRHQVQRGYEPRKFRGAVTARSKYVRLSLYHELLEPFFRLFPRERICIVTFEDLFSGNQTAWHTILDHLKLAPRPYPGGAFNLSQDKPYLGRAMPRLQSAGIVDLTSKLPGPIKFMPRWIFRKHQSWHERRLNSMHDDISSSIIERIHDDTERLESLLGVASNLWPGGPGIAAARSATIGQPAEQERVS